MKPKPKREWLELVTGEKFFSTDHWVTVWQSRGLGRSHRREAATACRKVLDKHEANRIRYLAVIAHGGGRNDPQDRSRR